jgi:cytochrome c551/c552
MARPEYSRVGIGWLCTLLACGVVPAATAGEPDVQALLDRNGCLGCHGTTYKIVGPAYSAVAKRYRGDADALAKLEASIKGGSVGKWGQVPMPGFRSLNEAQVKALAEFVAKQ